MNTWRKLKDWYEGEFIPHDNDPNSQVVFVGGYQKRPPLVTAMLSVWNCWKENWQMIVGVLGLIVAIISLF